jgi:hypothetical protein
MAWVVSGAGENVFMALIDKHRVEDGPVSCGWEVRFDRCAVGQLTLPDSRNAV